jgi:hypothetical protein
LIFQEHSPTPFSRAFTHLGYCIKRIDGELVRQGTVAAERKVLLKWLAELPGPWYGAMEATIFTGLKTKED